jgi:tetratricopeptide (TPR) repeat protein
MGQDAEAWRARLEALVWLGRGPSGSLHNLLLDASLAAQDEGRLHASLALLAIDLAAVRALGSVTRAVEAAVWRARVLAALGRNEEALAVLDKAVEEAGTLAEPESRRRLQADLQETRGSLLSGTAPAEAIAALTTAIRLYQDSRFVWRVPPALQERARARLAAGDPDGAEADLEAAVSEFERRDTLLPPDVYRYRHFERSQTLFDDLIRLQVDRGRSEAALVVAERARRVELLGVRSRVAATGVADLGEGAAEAVKAAVEALPENLAVVEFAVAGDRLLIWIVQGGRVRFLPRSLGALPDRVEEFWRLLASPEGDRAAIIRHAEALYTDLVVPWIDDLPPGRRLVFAPDRFLHRLAFAALRDPRTGRWLGEEYVVSTTPGLGFLAPADLGSHKPATRRQTLLIGDPTFDRAEAGELPRLPGAVEEVRRLAADDPRAVVLLGEQAKKQVVLSALRGADVVHYAGHGVANPRNPWATFLPLAPPGAGASGLLLAQEVHDLGGGPWRVVVLSACGAPTGGELRSAGFPAMVSAFLAGGADSVVSSLWGVEDRAVQPLVVQLHRGLRDGLSAPEALHRSRLLLLQRTPAPSPHLWASLESTGRAIR